MVRQLRRLNIWLIIFTLIAYVSPYVKPSEVSFLMLIGVTYPWLLLLHIIFIIVWAVSRIRYWWYSAVCILAGWSYCDAFIGISFSPPKKDANTLSVLSFNVNGFAFDRYKNRQKEAKTDLNIFFEQQNADIICLQEAASDDREMAKALAEYPFLSQYPYRSKIKTNTIVFISKYPITQHEDIPTNENGSNGSSFANISWADTLIRVYGFQLQSNSISGLADTLAEEGSLDSKESWIDALRMLKRFRRWSIKREKEVDLLTQHIRQSPFPTIACGDLNDIPVSYTYQTISGALSDAFRAKGWGIGTTYGGKIPFLRIDYIFASKQWHPLSYKTFKSRFSDHYPVAADFVFK